MAAKNFAEIDTGFPIYGLRFINNHTLLACGGGGEGNNGIPNKVTAVRCSFTVSDKNRRLQKFREITLPSNEDSPMCVEFCRSSADDNSRYSIFLGCNQSTELIRSMNINNNLRKYSYTDDEHLRFSDAVQFDDSLSVESIGEYPKIVHLSSDSAIGGMMTSRIPSEIFIFNPESLELTLRFKPTAPSEIKDFHLSPSDSGKTLTYVTASFVETISTNSGNSISSSSNVDKKTAKTLGKYFFSKVRYIDESKVIITAALRNGRGAAVLEYNTNTRKVTKEKLISKKIKGIVAIDVSKSAGVFAVAGNDFSVSLLRLSDFKVVNTYPKLHKFAVTCLSFSPDGKKLATGSASNTLNVLLVKKSSGGFFSFIYSLFRFIFFAVLVAVFAAFVQQAHENGDLDKYLELSKIYGAKALVHAQHYQEVGLELSQKYGKEYFELSQHYGKIGLTVAREQTIKGVELIKEQLNKRKASTSDEPTTAESVFTESTHLPEWVSEATETTSTIHSDIVEQHTKDVHELTKAPGPKDTLSIISEATQISILSTTAQSEEPLETHAAPKADEPIAIESSISETIESKELSQSTTTSISSASTPKVESAQVEQSSTAKAEYYEPEIVAEPSSTETADPETSSSSSSDSEILENETAAVETPQTTTVVAEEPLYHVSSTLSETTDPQATDSLTPEIETASNIEEPDQIVPEAEETPSAVSETPSAETIEEVKDAEHQIPETAESEITEETLGSGQDSVPADEIPVSSNEAHAVEESSESSHDDSKLDDIESSEPFTESETISFIEPETISFIEPETISFVEPETISFVEPETISFVEPETISFVEPETISFIEPETISFVEPEPSSSEIAGGIESDILSSEDVQPDEPIEFKEEVAAHSEASEIPQEVPQATPLNTIEAASSEIIEETPIADSEPVADNAAEFSEAILEETLNSVTIDAASFVEELPTSQSATLESPDIISPEHPASQHEGEAENVVSIQTSPPEEVHAEHDEL